MSTLGTKLLTALGSRDHAQSRATPEALEVKRRAFTLMAKAYDSARRALVYLRWAEDDVELTLPSLYPRSKRKAAVETESAGAAAPGAEQAS